MKTYNEMKKEVDEMPRGKKKTYLKELLKFHDENSRKARLRRLLRKQGYRLSKSRVKNTHINNMGGYMIIDCWSNGAVRGVNHELNLDKVEEFIKQMNKPEKLKDYPNEELVSELVERGAITEREATEIIVYIELPLKTTRRELLKPFPDTEILNELIERELITQTQAILLRLSNTNLARELVRRNLITTAEAQKFLLTGEIPDRFHDEDDEDLEGEGWKKAR